MSEPSPRDVAVKFSRDATKHYNQNFDELATLELQQALVAALLYVGDGLAAQPKEEGRA